MATWTVKSLGVRIFYIIRSEVVMALVLLILVFLQ